MKYFCFLLYSRLGNGVPMVTKLVLKIHALCNKNEISKVAKNVMLLIMDLPSCKIGNTYRKKLLAKSRSENKNTSHCRIGKKKKKNKTLNVATLANAFCQMSFVNTDLNTWIVGSHT